MPLFDWNFSHRPDPCKHLAQHGLLIGVEITVHPAAKAFSDNNLPVPHPVIGSAIIDTGCTVTSIDLGVAKQLGLAPMSIAQIGTAGGVKKVPTFAFCVKLAEGLTFPCVPGIGCDIAGHGIQVLVGLDLLSRCLFVMNGPSGTFTIAT